MWSLVIGANDVVNPAARHDKSSPIYGMPIIDADKANTCFAIKRSKNPGFAGIDNELYLADHTFMLFGDAKAVVGELVKQLTGGGADISKQSLVFGEPLCRDRGQFTRRVLVWRLLSLLRRVLQLLVIREQEIERRDLRGFCLRSRRVHSSFRRRASTSGLSGLRVAQHDRSFKRSSGRSAVPVCFLIATFVTMKYWSERSFASAA